MTQDSSEAVPSDVAAPSTETVEGSGLVMKVAVIIALIGMGKVAAMSNRGAVGTGEMRLLGIVLAEIFLLIVAIVNVDFVFSVLLFYLPFSQRLPGDYGTAINITNILIVIVLFGLFLRSIKEGGHFFIKTELDRWIAVWLLLLIISFFRSALQENRDWFLLVTLIKRFCTPLFIYYLASWMIRDRRGIANCVFVIMVTTLMVAVLATKDTSTPTHFSWERRESGVVNQANILAAFLVYYMFYFFSFFRMNTSNPKYWLLLPCLYPCLRGIIITFSRGGYVALAGSALFISYLTRKWFFFVVLIALLVVWVQPEKFLPNAVVERIKGTVVETRNVYQQTETKELENSAHSRIMIWQAGLRMIMANPLLGVGYGQFPMHLAEYGYGAYMDAHNGYILIAAEMGIPALIVFILLTIRMFRVAMAIYQNSADTLYAALGLGFATGVVGLWLANVFGSRFNTTETMSYFWVLAAMVMLIRRMQEQIENGGEPSPAPEGPPPDKEMKVRPRRGAERTQLLAESGKCRWQREGKRKGNGRPYRHPNR